MFLRVCFLPEGIENETFFDFFAPELKHDLRRLNKKNKLLRGWKIKIDSGTSISEMKGSVLKKEVDVGSNAWIFSGSKSTMNRESSVKT